MVLRLQAQGVDFGPYCIWRRDAIRKGVQVDFAICGIGWGDKENDTWDINKKEIKKENRRLIYQFFNHEPPWKKQADFILKEYEAVDAQAVFIDLERSYFGLRPDLDIQHQSVHCLNILNKVNNNVGGRVGGYSNFHDYWLVSQYVDLSPFPWWFADPDRFKLDHPGWGGWWDKIDRPEFDYHFDQWSWKGHAKELGATNNKFDMDMTQFKYSPNSLDIWLGIEKAPKPKTPSHIMRE